MAGGSHLEDGGFQVGRRELGLDVGQHVDDLAKSGYLSGAGRAPGQVGFDGRRLDGVTGVEDERAEQIGRLVVGEVQ